MTELRYCLQSKTKWFDGDSWWVTQNSSTSIDYLKNNSLPALKQHDKEVKAKDCAIVGYAYRIVIEIVMVENL